MVKLRVSFDGLDEKCPSQVHIFEVWEPSGSRPLLREVSVEVL